MYSHLNARWSAGADAAAATADAVYRVDTDKWRNFFGGAYPSTLPRPRQVV